MASLHEHDSAILIRVDRQSTATTTPRPPPSPTPLQAGSGSLVSLHTTYESADEFSTTSLARAESSFSSHRLSVKPGGRRYSVQKQGHRVSVCRISKHEEEDVPNDEVDVPPEIFDVLANNMPRLLQLISHWSKRTGEVTNDQFERVLHTLGVRYTEEQVSKLFRVLDADANGKVGLDEMKPDPKSA